MLLRLLVLLLLIGALLWQMGRLTLDGEDLVNWDEAEVELLCLDFALLGVLVLHMAHQSSLSHELSLTGHALENRRCHVMCV